MHVIAGFESQIAAQGGAMAVVRAARQDGREVDGVALIRRDSELAIHVDRLRGFDLPAHVMRLVDDAIDSDEGAPTLERGEAAFVVSLRDGPGADATGVVENAALTGHGALWVRCR